MTATKADPKEVGLRFTQPRGSKSSNGSSSLVDLSRLSISSPSTRDGFEYLSIPAASRRSSVTEPKERKARLIYCKSHVAIHPTTFNADNVSGYLALVEVDSPLQPAVDHEGNVKVAGKKELLVSWVPEELLSQMDDIDREGYKRVESRENLAEEEDGFVFVSLPPPKGEKYAFSIPVSSVYSLLVYPPSLSHWHGSATVNLTGGLSLPTLYFHDDDKPPAQRGTWGFTSFLRLLQARTTVLRSRLLVAKTSHGAELWLINPSKADREVHESPVEEPQREPVTQGRRSSFIPGFDPYPPKPLYPSAAVLAQSTPKQTLLESLSTLTNLSRKTAQQVLAQPLAQSVVTHLPPAVRSLVTVPGEKSRYPARTGKGGEVENEFESARLYLARWARVVAEEGERARKTEIAGRASLNDDVRVGSEDLASSLGVFSLLTSPKSKRAIPNPTRTPQHPISSRDWDSFIAQGRDELYIRREIFKRGFSNSPDASDKRARREEWEVLLGTLTWAEGGFSPGESGKSKRREAREMKRLEKRQEYERLKNKWTRKIAEKGEQQGWKEEWHRIDVDCRRTDRSQTMFAVPSEAVKRGEEEKEAGGAGSGWDHEANQEEGGMTALNPHVAALRTILMTYHSYSPELGYVQGMSDLLSPIYAVFDGNEADAFWGLVGLMRTMETNFLRDQSGMKRQLSTLQQLIGVMDPELYAHLERTDSLNLFFCFRWILIAFKREFAFENVIKLWEILWTDFYSNQFVLFVALAVLLSHRDVILRYLTEFDEVLKYANDLSGSIDLDTTLAQAEVLFLSFRVLIEDLDHDIAVDKSNSGGIRRRRRSSAASQKPDSSEITNQKAKAFSPDLRALLDSWQGKYVPAE